MFGKLLVVIAAVILIFMLGLILTAPLTWLLMLFLGNLGLKISFWGCIPGALVLGTLVAPKQQK